MNWKWVPYLEMIGMNAMAKYIVYTTWYHEKGLRPAEEMQDGMRKNVKPLSPAEDVFWWKMDDNHHQSITIYSSEDVALVSMGAFAASETCAHVIS